VDFTTFVNPESLRVMSNAKVERSVLADPPEARYQPKRISYFVKDAADWTDERPVFKPHGDAPRQLGEGEGCTAFGDRHRRRHFAPRLGPCGLGGLRSGRPYSRDWALERTFVTSRKSFEVATTASTHASMGSSTDPVVSAAGWRVVPVR